MKKLIIAGVVLIVLLSSCEWINQPVESMIVVVENNNENALTSTVVTVRLSGDLEDQTIDFGTVSAGQTLEAVVDVGSKFFDVFEVNVSYSTTVPDGGSGTAVTIDPDSPVSLTDPVGSEEYHGFRALATSNFRVHVGVSSHATAASSLEQIENELWMGYVLPE